MNPHLISFVTDFGDTAVTLPLAAILALSLWRIESSASALAALQSLALCLTAMVVLKLTLITCGRQWNAGLVSPSGHAAIALTVYGMAAMVLASWTTAWWRASVAAVATSLVGAVAASRVWLGAHTIAEVGVGIIVGGAALGVFAATYRWSDRTRSSRIRPILLGLVLLLPLVALHGIRLPAERMVRQLAVMLRNDVGVCAVVHAGSALDARPRLTNPVRAMPRLRHATAPPPVAASLHPREEDAHVARSSEI